MGNVFVTDVVLVTRPPSQELTRVFARERGGSSIKFAYAIETMKKQPFSPNGVLHELGIHCWNANAFRKGDEVELIFDYMGVLGRIDLQYVSIA